MTKTDESFEIASALLSGSNLVVSVSADNELLYELRFGGYMKEAPRKLPLTLEEAALLVQMQKRT